MSVYRIALVDEMLVYRCLHGSAPPYLASDLQRVADLDDRRRLRSSLTDALNVPSTRLSTVGDSCGCSTCVEQFAGHCHIVAIAADIQETTQDATVCSQLSRLLAAATSDNCFFFLSFRIARTSLSRYSFFVRCPRSL